MSFDKKMLAFALLSCSFMSAIEITIVTTALPSIAKDLNGFSYSSYIFSVYLLTSAVATTVFGKLSDVYGRKKLLQLSILIFIIGSTMCGLSNSIFMLIIFRLVQGVGAGAINTLSMATIGDVFDVEDRAKIQGYNSTVWSVASLIAPVLGGIILLRLTWHWVFFINLPIGIISMILIEKNYKKASQPSGAKLDIKGLAVLTLAIAAIIQSISELEKNSVLSPRVYVPFIVAVVLVAIFSRIEKNVENPVLPFKLFSPQIIIVLFISFLSAMILIGFDVYNPAFMQNVQGHSPVSSAVPMLPMSLMWVTSSFLLSKTFRKYSMRTISLVSLAVLSLGTFGLYMLRPESGFMFMGIASAITGFGFGGSFNMMLFIVQETLSKEDMGIASGAVMFVRTVGQTLGISIFGLITNNAVASYFSERNMVVDTSSVLNNTEVPKKMITEAIFGGYNNIYLACFIIAVVCTLLSVFISRKTLEEA